MKPADYIIHIFGGVRPTARALNRAPSSVTAWRWPRKRKGLNHTIPSALHQKILKIAKDEGLDITASDLIYGRDTKK